MTVFLKRFFVGGIALALMFTGVNLAYAIGVQLDRYGLVGFFIFCGLIAALGAGIVTALDKGYARFYRWLQED